MSEHISVYISVRFGCNAEVYTCVAKELLPLSLRQLRLIFGKGLADNVMPHNVRKGI